MKSLHWFDPNPPLLYFRMSRVSQCETTSREFLKDKRRMTTRFQETKHIEHLSLSVTVFDQYHFELFLFLKRFWSVQIVWCEKGFEQIWRKKSFTSVPKERSA